MLICINIVAIMQQKISYWCCTNCVQLFPFHALSDEELSIIHSGVDANNGLLGNNISKFELFGCYENKFCNIENYIDTDINFYNNIYVNGRYYYFNELKIKAKQVRAFLSFIVIIEAYFPLFIK